MVVTVNNEYLTEENKGEDIIIDENGESYLMVTEPRAYKIVEQPDWKKGQFLRMLQSMSEQFRPLFLHLWILRGRLLMTKSLIPAKAGVFIFAAAMLAHRHSLRQRTQRPSPDPTHNARPDGYRACRRNGNTGADARALRGFPGRLGGRLRPGVRRNPGMD